MNSHQIFGLVQVIVVIALVVIAAALATPKGRVPLALRGLMRIMQKDRSGRAPAARGEDAQPGRLGSTGREGAARTECVPAWKRLLAFVLVILAFMLAMIVV